MADDKIVVTRTLNAPIEKVWDAWTNPDSMRKWYSPENMTTPDVSSEVAVGGLYSVHMHADKGPDGKPMDVKAVGKYTEVEENRKLAFSFRWEGSDGPETSVVLEMEEVGDDKTKLTLTHVGLGEAAAEHKKGWESTFNSLESYLG